MKLPWLLISLGIGQLGSAHAARRAEHHEAVLDDRGFQRPIGVVAPVGDQPVEPDRIDDRARQDMRADFGAFFDDHHRNVRVELLQPDRRGEAGGARADDDDVEVHRFAGGQFGFDGHSCSLGQCARRARKKRLASWIGRAVLYPSRPNVDWLFDSAARHARTRVLLA